MMHGYGVGFGGWGIFGMLFQIALLVGFVYLIVYLFQSFTRPKQNEEKTSLQILEERYARGEISEEEFKTKKRILKDS
ncbi:SHOCT domain-containing protein [Bacillus shivajii]|uniref:SHOCT domain-containing protein n=1 Tax=Bacillus shivajii TaxID=1983719 RepID=UPI001CF94BA8|nr:SHOCT domain-containing protein [Bacillus shivajii]UCZ53548.1 SHOCT domain-containing protein [Bacillus shivajii]